MEKNTEDIKEEETKGKIIFVNSFKGGAGKTTLSLSYCISALFDALPWENREKYINVIYMDLDILGTGTCYLFDGKYTEGEKYFNRTKNAVKIPLHLKDDVRKEFLYAAFLEPGLKNSSSYGEPHFINHQNIAQAELKEKVLSFIKQKFIEVPETLLVLDCAPGFSDFEQEILLECYKMVKKDILSVQEDYVTTLDHAHIHKCIQCLGDSVNGFKKLSSERTMNIVINDVQNYDGWLKDKADAEWDRIKKDVLGRLKKADTKIWRWRYSENVAMSSVYLNCEKVENHAEDYLFTGETFKEI